MKLVDEKPEWIEMEKNHSNLVADAGLELPYNEAVYF